MEAKLFKFTITDFEEVYTVIDHDNKRLHISPVNYSYSLTLDLTGDLKDQVEQYTKYEEQTFGAEVRQVANEIIISLGGVMNEEN